MILLGQKHVFLLIVSYKGKFQFIATIFQFFQIQIFISWQLD